MTKDLISSSTPRALWSMRLLLFACLLLVPQFVLAHSASAGTTVATDDFNRADGGLGSAWAAMSDNGMSISSQQVIGLVGANSGDIRTAEAYSSDQYSQVEVTSTALTGGQWVGPAVRAQAGGKSAYLGIYYWNFGSPVLMLFLRNGGGWTQLGSTYSSGALAAGTQLKLVVVGSKVSFLQNGVQRITATDGTLAGGAPGVMAYGNATADNWAGQDVTTSSTSYSIGGTVSGLSGTVVLQDNGGDDLSVTGNGSFTFGTQVASGDGYAVTVKTNPAGQNCSVASGSGTVGSANVTNVAVSCANLSTTPGADDFNRADGGLGSAWAAMSGNGMSISSQQVVGVVGANSGDIRTAEAYSSNQSSQVEVTSTALTGGQWVGPAVRAQAGGQSTYVGIYYWNSGSPVLMLFLRNQGGWTQLGSTYSSGALAAGTQLRLVATGNTLSFQVNGVQRITATDGTLTGGAPGIMAYGNATADNWTAGAPSGGGTTSYSIGGTVSGLSGTVVLQDNGGDDLSVTGNGSFTFGTAVASGAGYAVTVKTSPAGQSCTVASGSGTVGSANVTNVAVSCANVTTTPGADDFNRSDGGLGSAWAAISDNGMSISAQQVVGVVGSNSGDIRTAEAYPSDQYSQVEVTSTQLTGGQWVGTMVRAQADRKSAYVGIYYWNSGNPEVMLFRRDSSGWTQLGSYNSGALAAGTRLRLVAVGNTLSFQVNGVQRVTASDGNLTGGAPGVMAYGNATADNWAGGSAGFQVSYLSTNAQGVKSYNVLSANNGYGPQTLRVLSPTNPAGGVAHNFLIVLPVEAGTGSSYGDGLATLQAIGAQDKYNLTIVEPTFTFESWDADNATDPNIHYETFLSQELVPWIKQNLATTGNEQTWLIGFSKSGIGAQDLILKHPGVFTLAASWDFPADMSSYNQMGYSPAANYGTDANYQANYRLTTSFVDSHKGPFLSSNRIWIGSYGSYKADVADYDSILKAEGILHSTETPQAMTHRWDTGWVPIALAALYQDSTNLH